MTNSDKNSETTHETLYFIQGYLPEEGRYIQWDDYKTKYLDSIMTQLGHLKMEHRNIAFRIMIEKRTTDVYEA